MSSGFGIGAIGVNSGAAGGAADSVSFDGADEEAGPPISSGAGAADSAEDMGGGGVSCGFGPPQAARAKSASPATPRAAIRRRFFNIDPSDRPRAGPCQQITLVEGINNHKPLTGTGFAPG